MKQTFDLNTKGTDYFVGDLHGHIDEFLSILKDKQFDKTKDRVFSVGDLADRGPRNFETLELMHEDWFELCMGNHEYMMLQGVNYKEFAEGWDTQWTETYGSWYKTESGPRDVGRLQAVLEATASLPMSLEVETEVGTIGLVHSEVPGNDWSVMADIRKEHFGRLSTVLSHYDICLWSRNAVIAQDRKVIKGIDYVVHGHTPTSHIGSWGNPRSTNIPLSLGNRAYIDTGAGKKGHVTVLSAKEIKSVVEKDQLPF